MLPLISVIIPVYNRGNLITRAIESVRKQTYSNLEILIIDDGSTDNIELIIRKLIENDSRLRLIRHQTNKGANYARNTGIKYSNGKYISFLDSDDEWFPKKIEKQYKVIMNSNDPKLGVVYCLGIININNSSYELSRCLYKGDLRSKILSKNLIRCGGSSVLIKREVFNIVGYFDESTELNYGGAQDYELWIRIAQKFHFDYSNKILVKIYQHQESISYRTTFKKAILRLQAFIYIYKKYKHLYKKHPQFYNKFLIHIWTGLLLAKKYKLGFKYVKNAIKCYPYNFQNYYYLLIFLLKNSFKKLESNNVRFKKLFNYLILIKNILSKTLLQN